MLNQTVIVGRLVENPEIIKEDEKNVCNITVAVSRPFKNDNGEFDTDFIPVVMWNGIADNMAEYCHKGDLIGVKGRLEMRDSQLLLVAEKITFLSSKKDNE